MPDSHPAAPGPDGQDERELLERMREQLAAMPAADFIAETAVPLISFAFLRLGIPPEQNEQFRDLGAARLLIDALKGLLDAVQGRLGAGEAQLRDALADLQLTYAELAGRAPGAAAAGAQPGGQPGAPPAADPGPAQGLRRPSGLWVPGQD
jgi:hypothetical protein